MKSRLLNDNWKFWEVTNSFALNWAPPADAVIVDLPHDAMIEKPQDPDCPSGANTGYRKGGVYSYSRTLYAASPDRTYILKVEGAYMNAFVYVNGQLASKRPFGYTVFYVPLNRFLEYGKENEIRIQVRSGAEPNSRWYSGTGLYRDVYLLEAGEQYIKPDSVEISTTELTTGSGISYAKIHVDALIVNRSAEKNGSLEITFRDASGKTAAVSTVPIDDIAISYDTMSELAACRIMQLFDDTETPDLMYYPVQADLLVHSPLLWDAETPHLYTCTLALKSRTGQVLDTHSDTFGIRKLSVSPEEGFRVNGQEVKLRGSCIHHDSGLLGAKTFEDVHVRQISLLKEAGFNAIRCAHNPAAPALLRACDKVGMYVMDESFDIWTRHKSNYDYGMYFEEWWEADVEAMVRNDFNHPSVVMYSIGNEIPEIGTPQGGRIAQMICEKIHSMDDTRFTLASVNGIFSVGDGLNQIVHDVAADLAAQGNTDVNVNDFMAFMHIYMNDMTSHPIVDQTISVPFQYTDIAGYNYMGSRYDIEHALHPERVIVGSETGIADIVYNWERVKKYPYVIGDFCWTGWEYLGESGIGSPNYANGSNPFGNAVFPLQISGTGAIDITGHRLPMSYFREIVFGLRKDPYIAVQDPVHYGEDLIRNPWIISDAIGSWSFSQYKGKPVVVEVYSDSDEVELFKNGVSLGRKPAGAATGFMAMFGTTYEPGVLTAVSYNAAGEETGRYELQSAEDDLKLIVSEEPAYSVEIPVPEEPSQQETIFSDITNYFAAKDPMNNMPSADQLKAEYQASSMRAKQFSEQLKAQYLNGNMGKPELILDIGESRLLNGQPAGAAAAPAANEADASAAAVSEPAPEAAPVTEASFEEPVPQDYEIRFIRIELADDNGIVAADQDTTLHLTLEGNARMLAFGSADPKPVHNFNEDVTCTYHGRAQLILKKPVSEEPVTIRITSDSGLEGTLEI